MIEMIRQQMEREYALEEAGALSKLKTSRMRSAAHYLIFLCAAVIAYALLFTVATRSDLGNFQYLGWLLALIAIAVSEQARTDVRTQDKVISFLEKADRRLNFGLRTDFLFLHFWASVAFLWLPLLWNLTGFFSHRHWIEPSTTAFAPIKETINQAINYSAGLLGVQLTLFTFILGTVLGRYSGRLAGTIIRHRSIFSLVIFGLVSLTLLGAGQLWGLPDTLIRTPTLITILCLPALVITVFTTLSCIQTESAILYFGKTEAFKLRRQFKPPWPQNDKESWFWKSLVYYGLYLRDVDNFSPLSVPQKPINRATRACRTLFNAANVSLQAGQDEAFEASLTAILLIAAGYTEGRTKYFAGDDLFFSFLNDQMAAVIGAAAKAPNQSLISTAVKTSGVLGLLSLQIGNLPETKEAGHDIAKGHTLVIFWIGLLKESFLASHRLQRTSAPFEALTRLKAIACTALDSGFAEVASLTYTSTIREIQATCITGKDSYYTTIASQCLKDLLSVWYYPILRDKCHLGIHHTHRQMASTVLELAKSQILLRPGISFDFSDVPNTLTGKTASDTVILQDVFFAIALRTRKEPWEHRACVQQLKEILDLNSEIGCIAAAAGQGLAEYFSTSLFEMAYGVFRGIPDLPSELQDELEGYVFEAWSALSRGQANAPYLTAHQSREAMFAVLGLAAANVASSPREAMKLHLQAAIGSILTQAKTKLAIRPYVDMDDDWAYLQLTGAWAKELLKDAVLAEEIASTITQGKPFRTSSGLYTGSSTILTSLGYPEVFPHNDFHFPPLRNIRRYISKDQGNEFIALQNSAVSDAVLLAFACDIRERRRALRAAIDAENDGPETKQSSPTTSNDNPAPPEK